MCSNRKASCSLHQKIPTRLRRNRDRQTSGRSSYAKFSTRNESTCRTSKCCRCVLRAGRCPSAIILPFASLACSRADSSFPGSLRRTGLSTPAASERHLDAGSDPQPLHQLEQARRLSTPVPDRRREQREPPARAATVWQLIPPDGASFFPPSWSRRTFSITSPLPTLLVLTVAP